MIRAYINWLIWSVEVGFELYPRGIEFFAGIGPLQVMLTLGKGE